jgi:putative transposase
MPRVARIVVAGVPHHVTQRGNNRHDVFFVDDDRRAYLNIFDEQSRKYGLRILAYCLMNNHVHHIVIPETADALAKAVGRTHWLYTQYINRLHRRSGHLWQNRFYSNAMDDAHTLLATRYTERNPIRARICRVARRYEWSSAAAHCGGMDKSGLLDLEAWKQLAEGVDWEGELAIALEPRQMERIRHYTHTGRPLASDSFLSKLERAVGRRLRPLTVGRPRKRKQRIKK